MGAAIVAEGLVKTFGEKVRALAGVSLEVPAGTVLGLPGPHGARPPVLFLAEPTDR